MSAAATHGALAINIFAVDNLYYNIKPNHAVAVFTLLGSQLLGYGIAGETIISMNALPMLSAALGMMRSFLVYPTYIVFPNLIPTIQVRSSISLCSCS
jgi:hypothetical protein